MFFTRRKYFTNCMDNIIFFLNKNNTAKHNRFKVLHEYSNIIKKNIKIKKIDTLINLKQFFILIKIKIYIKKMIYLCIQFLNFL